LDDLEHQNRGVHEFFGDFGLQDTFQERNAPKTIKIDKDKLRTKFSALNIDFDSPSLHFLGLRKPAHKGFKERNHRKKSLFFTAIGQYFAKTVADRHGHAAFYHNKQ